MKSIVLLLLLSFSTLSAQYIPPASGTWDTLQPASLGWNVAILDTLPSFLQQTNTKAFIILKNGKIAYERYFGNFTADSIWYWASAGKSLVGTLVHKAEQEGLLDLQNPVSTYLQQGWTIAPQSKEDLIALSNLMTMTSGLNDGVQDIDCMLDTCLEYLADAGTRWAYHNAPYRLLQDILDTVTGVSPTLYCFQKFGSIGITGAFLDYVFYSKPRSMARFGLLIAREGRWGNNQMIDSTRVQEMTHPSQGINQSYGQLWWLNGQANYMLPQSQFVFPGKLIPAGPDSLVMALGKNDQKIYVWKDADIVVIRMGNSAGQPLFALSSYDNQLWTRLSALFANEIGLQETVTAKISVFPNPSRSNFHFGRTVSTARLFDLNGKLVKEIKMADHMDISDLPSGTYSLLYLVNQQMFQQLVGIQ